MLENPPFQRAQIQFGLVQIKVVNITATQGELHQALRLMLQTVERELLPRNKMLCGRFRGRRAGM